MTLKNIIPHLISILIIVLVNVVYFYPQLEGKVLRQGDIVSSIQSNRYIKDIRKETGKPVLWNPAIFGGMPVLAGAPSKGNKIVKVYKVLKLGFKEPIGLFVAGCLMAYLMFVLLGFNPWMSLIFSIPSVFALSNVILWDAGHNSKIRTLIFTPLLIAGVLKTFEHKKYLLGFILLSLGFAFSFFMRHPQMTYYILLAFMIYGIVFLIQTIKTKDWPHLLKGIGVVIAALVLGMSTSLTKTWSLYDYSKSTMRGKAILKADPAANSSSSSNVDGLDWEYATAWSNNFGDLMAGLIPGFVGGASGQEIDRDFKTHQFFGERSPLYWGGLPFTESPFYFGASILFLFVLGLFCVQGNLKYWLGFGILWMILLSMGRYFETFNKIIFELFPFYSSFRAPQTVLNAAPWFITLLAAYGLKSFIDVNEKYKKKKKSKTKTAKLRALQNNLIYSLAIVGGICLFVAILGPSLFNFSADSDSNYASNQNVINALIADRKKLMTSDAWRSLFFIVVIAGTLYAYFKNRIPKTALIVVVGIAVIVDLLGVDSRYLAHKDFLNKQTLTANIEPRSVDNQILSLEKNRHDYRVQDLSINTYNSSRASANFNTVGGYNAAKMQRIQDLIDRQLNKGNMQVYNMLNTKYFITNANDNKARVQTNAASFGPAWFVGNIKTVNTPNEEIDALSNTSLNQTAIVLENEFPTYLDGLSPGIDSSASIEISKYEPDDIVYTSSSNKEMLAVFSEMWYGPDKGWKAYIDGNEVEIIRANYALRALRVPAGQHEIKFEFRPRSYYLGEPISFASSVLLILLCLGYSVYEYRMFSQKEQKV